jgi:general secretion pathway protein D
MSRVNNIGALILIGVIFSSSLYAETLIRYETKFNNDIIRQLKQEASLPGAASNGSPRSIVLQYADPKAVLDTLKSMWPSLNGAVDMRTRALFFLGDEALFKKVKAMAMVLDKLPQQYQIEVKVVEVNSKKVLQYDGPFSKLLDRVSVSSDGEFIMGDGYGINLELSLLLDTGEAKLLAKPILTAIDGQKATVTVGEKVPYLTHIIHEKYIAEEIHQTDAGVDLEISPKMVSGNMVSTGITAQVAAVKNWEILGGSRYPVLSTRRASAQVFLKKGETLVLAGLYDEQDKEVKHGVPVVSDIPFLGALFTSKHTEKQKTDIVFLITLL